MRSHRDTSASVGTLRQAAAHLPQAQDEQQQQQEAGEGAQQDDPQRHAARHPVLGHLDRELERGAQVVDSGEQLSGLTC